MHAFDAPVPSEYCLKVWYRKLEWWIYHKVKKKYENVFTCFDTIHERDRHLHR